MTRMIPQNIPTTDVWKTAAEWAAVGLVDMPTTERNINALAKRHNWRDLGPSFARKRKGRGGGWEYHLNCLPTGAQAEYRRRVARAEADAQSKVAAQKDARRALTLPQDLPARRRRAMEARAVVLREIDRRVFSRGISQRKAILSLVADVAADLKHEDGVQSLAPDLLEACIHANDRGRGLSRSQIFAWAKAYREDGIAGLAPRATRVAAPIDETYPFLAEFMRHYAVPTKPSIAHALEKYRRDLSDKTQAPNYDTVRRALTALKGSVNWLDAYKGREGPLQLKARLAYVKRSTEGLEPTTIYTADGKTFDAEVAHPIHGGPFKPEITSVLDVVTRKCVGWSLGLAESAEVVADALRRACQENGIPAIFYVDRGPGYKNARLGDPSTGLCARLGISKTHSIPQNSQARGIIERFNGTVWNPLAKEYYTYLGAPMDREAAQRVHKATRKDAGKLISWARFVDDVAEAVERYNNRPHRSLRKLRDPVTGRMRHASPNEAWDWFVETGFKPFEVQPAEADDLFRPYVKRRVHRGRIQWLTNDYFSNDLERWHGRDVLVGYDTQDASRIWVREIDQMEEGSAPGALITVAEFGGNTERYVPLTFERAAQEKRVRQALKRADKKITSIKAELDPPAIEHRAELPLDMMKSKAPIAADPEAIAAKVVPLKKAPKPADVHPDVELAFEVLADPSRMTAGWHRLLSDALKRRAATQIMKRAGVDIPALTKILKSPPAPLTSSTGAE